MRQFIKRAIQRIGNLNPEQFRELLLSSSREIDRLETALDSLPTGILVCDTSQKLILANKFARRFLSIVSFEQGREFIWSVIPDELVAEFLTLTLLSGDKAEEREFYVEVLGMQRLLSVSVMPMVQDHQVSGSLVLVDDITEKRSREARMRRTENLASLTTLAAGVAHEIKNPLGSISIHVQLIQKTLDKSKKLFYESRHSGFRRNVKAADDYFGNLDKYLKIVNEEIERLNSIVVDFLFAVRPMNAELKRGNINTLISELAKFVSFELTGANIKCELQLADNLPPLDFDVGLMKQALLNLINNAAAAMGEGGLLTIATEEGEGEVRIIITDTGAGIPEESLSKIFEPYFTTKKNGTGLGLTLVFKIVKEHQGEISVKSREGRGTAFTITLPVPQTHRQLITYNEIMETK